MGKIDLATIKEYIKLCNMTLNDSDTGAEGFRYMQNKRKFQEENVHNINSFIGISGIVFKTLTLRDLIREFNIGFDPAFSIDTNGEIWKAIIIPIGNNSFIARNINADENAQNRYVRVGSSPFFNIKVLNDRDSREEHVYITKGELDALSIITISKQAVSLGGLGNVDEFLNYIDTNQINSRKRLIIDLGNTEEGKIAANKLLHGLKERKFSAYKADLCGQYPDINCAMRNCDDIVYTPLFRSIEQEEEHIFYMGKPEEAREQYLLDNSCSSKLSLFLQRVAQNKNANSISTGFKRLDTELCGGLFEGLYIIGGISSLGKSAFALQMADNIAGSGRDVMFFALEMSTDELIARSISREIYEGINDKTSKSVDAIARTTRDILNGNDGGNQEVINDAINRYRNIMNIFFSLIRMKEVALLLKKSEKQ